MSVMFSSTEVVLSVVTSSSDKIIFMSSVVSFFQLIVFFFSFNYLWLPVPVLSLVLVKIKLKEEVYYWGARYPSPVQVWRLLAYFAYYLVSYLLRAHPL